MTRPCILQFIAAFHNEKVIFDYSFIHIVFSMHSFALIHNICAYHIFWPWLYRNTVILPFTVASRYPEFAQFNYDGASYQIRLIQYQRKLFFVDGLKQLRKHLNIYESVTINFMACEHRWNFDLHFSPSLEQQAYGRPLPAFRMHVWTIELTQALLGDPEPLVIYIDLFCIMIKSLPKKLTQVFFFIFRCFHLLQQYTFLLVVSIWPF